MSKTAKGFVELVHFVSSPHANPTNVKKTKEEMKMAIRINVNVKYGTIDGEITELKRKLSELGFDCINFKNITLSGVHEFEAEYLKI